LTFYDGVKGNETEIVLKATGTSRGSYRYMEKTFRLELSQRAGTAERITASAGVSGDSAWYAGHFPGNPILPGIAILALVEEAIVASELQEGRRVTITGIHRVRFRLPVKPDDRILLEVTRENKRGGMTYLFSVNLAGEPACTGAFTARLTEDPQDDISVGHSVKIS
jgi:3-hydroxyacyl-[acyl-carrier-protein] dehydratase